MINVYGIKSCDTCRKALKSLSAAEKDHAFHDIREEGLDAKKLAGWIKAVGWETLLNKKSTTWRGLDATETDDLDAAKAKDLMDRHPTLIKRPVFEVKGRVLVGFGPAVQSDVLA